MSRSESTAQGLLWKFCEKGLIQISQFTISILIARLLTPEAYGTIALLAVFISFSTIIINAGLSTAIVHEKQTDKKLYSSIFFFSLFVAFVLYIVLFFSSSSIASFYEDQKIELVLQVMALVLFPCVFNSIQIAILTKQMSFKKQFWGNLISTCISSITALIMAICNCGIWSLVSQQLLYQTTLCIVFLFQCNWRPSLYFSFYKLKKILNYSSKLLLANLLDATYRNIESIIVGKKYSAEILAFYSKGKQFPLILIHNIDGPLQSVLLPVFAKNQDDLSNLKKSLRQTISISTFVCFPMMFCLLFASDYIIIFLLGNEWIQCIPFLKWYCIIVMLFPMQTTNGQAFNAIGRSDIYLKLMFYKRSFGIVSILIATFYFESINAIIIASLATEIISVILSMHASHKFLYYPFLKQIKDFGYNLLTTCIAAIPIYFFDFSNYYIFLHVIFKIFIFLCLFFLLALILKNPNLTFIIKFFYNKQKLI